MDDEAFEKGEVTKVKRDTLTGQHFRIEVKYREARREVIASRDEIVDKNIFALLDFYENKLQLKDAHKL